MGLARLKNRTSQRDRWQVEVAGSWTTENPEGKRYRKNYDQSKVVFSSQILTE